MKNYISIKKYGKAYLYLIMLFLAGTVISMGIVLLGSFIVESIFNYTITAQEAGRGFQCLMQITICLIILYWALRYFALDVRETLKISGFNPLFCMFLCLMDSSMILCCAEFGYQFNLQVYGERIGTAMNAPTPLTIYTLISGVILAGCSEEIICRGVICKLLCRKCKPITTIILSALLFLIPHIGNFNWSPVWRDLRFMYAVSIINIFLSGMLYSLILLRTNCLFYSILSHMISNLAFYLYSAYSDVLPHPVLRQVFPVILLCSSVLFFISAKKYLTFSYDNTYRRNK